MFDWFTDIGDGIVDIGKSVSKKVKNAAEDVSDFGKDVASNVGDFFEGCGDRIKQGFKETGKLWDMTSEQWKEGAYMAAIGTGFLSTFQTIAQPINVVTGGAITGAGNAIADNTDVVVDVNGNVSTSVKEDVSGLSKFVTGFVSKTAEGLANSEIEIEEAIDEGDIDKANKIGSQILVKEAALTAGVTATVATGGAIGHAITAPVVTTAGATATTVGSKLAIAKGVTSAAAITGLYMKDSQNDVTSAIERREDGASDRTEQIVAQMCANNYLDKNDTENLDKVKNIIVGAIDSNEENAVFYALTGARMDGDIKLSLDYYKDPYRECDEIKNLLVEGDEASKVYQERVIEELGKRDAAEISAEECDRNITVAGYEYGYSDMVKNNEITVEQATRYAKLDTKLQYGDIDEYQYNKQVTMISLDDIDFTKSQKEAYSDYCASVAMGDITDQEMIDMMYEDPDFNKYFDENGVFNIPVKEIALAENSTQTMQAAYTESDVALTEQIETEQSNSILKEWSEKFGDGFKEFAETMYAKVLTAPVIGEKIAKAQVKAMQDLGLKSSVVDLDDENMSVDQLAEQLIDNAENALDIKSEQKTNDNTIYDECVNV